MANHASNLLITGRPGIGKTTVVVRAMTELHDVRVAGFLTEEIRDQWRRLGFAAETLTGARRIMAHVEIDSRHRVGRYGVDVAAIDEIVELALANDHVAQAFVVDEIGKMELYSSKFTDSIERLLADPRPLVASVALRGPGLISTARRRPDVELREVTLGNRDTLPGQVARWVMARVR